MMCVCGGLYSSREICIFAELTGASLAFSPNDEFIYSMGAKGSWHVFITPVLSLLLQAALITNRCVTQTGFSERCVNDGPKAERTFDGCARE